ncbi:MAG: PAS domain S-box protein [Hyphomicrobiaceae bacterium]
MTATLDTVLRRLAGCSRLVGRAFCEAMVGAIAETLSVPIVLLAEIDASDSSKARTVAVWSNGALIANFDYDLRGTPGSNVLMGEVCVYPSDVCALFPDDTLLADMGAEGYMGAPLRALDGRTIGLLAAISDKPLDTHSQAPWILEIFSGRAAAELERESNISQSEYLGRLVEGSSSEVYVFDAATLRFVLVNKGARDNLGYTMDELASLTPTDLKPEFTRESFSALLEPLRNGGESVLQIRTRHRRKDESEYPVNVRLQLLRDVGEPVFFASIEDITQSVKAEAELRNLDGRLRRLFAQSPAGIVETDATGRMTLVNRTWGQMLGYSEAELLERRVFDVTHPDSIPHTQDAIEKLIAGADGVVVEKNYIRKDGSVLPASSNVSALRSSDGTFEGIAAVVIDVSERLEAEVKIRGSEARLRKIIDGSLAFIGILEPDGTLMEANAPALLAGGIARDDVVGNKFWDCYWWSYDSGVADRLKQAVAQAAAGKIQRYDEFIRVAGDRRVTIDFMLSPVFTADGKVEFLVPSGFDISERKRQEALVKDLMREMNHRSKNLLTVVQAIARQMRKRSPEDFVSEFSNRLSALASCQDALLERDLPGAPIDAVIRSQLRHFGDFAGRRITWTGPEIHVSAIAAQSLGMAIYELATNAAKYGALSNDTGKIEIAWAVTEGSTETPRFTINWKESDGPVVTGSCRTGFGSFVLSRLVGSSLAGEAVRHFAPDGLRWSLSCPLDNLSTP